MSFWTLRPDEAEPFRLRWCPQCQRHRSIAEMERLTMCRGNGCGLRDPDCFATEQQQSEAITYQVARETSMGATPTLAPGTVQGLNDLVAAAHCVTPAVVLADDGTTRVGYRVRNLRGQVHAALLSLCFNETGVLFLNAFNVGSGGAAKAVVEENRTTHRTQVRDPLVVKAFTDDPTRSDRAIAKMTGVDHKTVGDILRRHGYRPAKWGR